MADYTLSDVAAMSGPQTFTLDDVKAMTPQDSPLSDFGSALAHNVMKPLHGAAQFVENAVAAGAAKLPDNPLSRAIVRTATADNAAQQQWEQQYQQSTPDNAASYAGATAGTVAPMMLSGPLRGLQAVGDAAPAAIAKVMPDVLRRFTPAVLPKIASGAVQGGVVAATNPVDNGGDYWSEKGGQVRTGLTLGGGIPAASSLVGGVFNGVRSALAPLTNPQSVVRAGLQRWGVPATLDAPQLVPGSLPTTAQVVANPDIVAAEKTLANNPAYRGQFEARNIANNQARTAALQGVAQTPEALDAAVQARTDTTAPLIDRLLTNGNAVPVRPILDQLEALAKSPLGVRPAIGGAASDIAAQIRTMAATDASGNATIGPAHLDAIRQNVKDYLAKYAPNGVVGTQQQAAFEPVRSAIVGAIDGANPGYRAYLEKYAQLSQPINTMETAQSIVGNLGDRARNAGGDPQLSLTGVNAQVKKALDSRYGVSPEAEATFRNLQADLQRASVSNGLRSSGSDTSYNLQAPNWLGRQLYGSEFQGGKVLPMIGSAVGGYAGLHTGGVFGLGTGIASGAYGGKQLAALASKRVNDALAEALLNPEVARSILQTPQGRSPVIQGLLSRVPQASLLMSEPVLTRPQPQGLLSTVQ